jgi:pimeloyl-ACP methyl ester carboxylesterase
LLAPNQTYFAQVAPAFRAPELALRSPNQHRAVLLIHGLSLHPFSRRNVSKAVLHEWQKPGSLLVKRLARDSDVYAFAYAEDVSVDDIAAGPGIAECVCRLRELGYPCIVLVGYSAGGLIARQFVEDNPHCGVSKVIQVCAPNGGSSWAEVRAVMPIQSAFLYSLTKEARKVALRGRADRRIPADIQFACIVGTGAGAGDGLVLCRSAWTEDLQQQGIPAYRVATTHWQMPRIRPGVEMIANLAAQDQPRWNHLAVAAVRLQLLGN